MAIRCEFIDFIIPIKNIDLVYPGGFIKYKQDHIQGFSGRLWHDEFLFRDGAMSPRDIEVLVQEWEALGLQGVVEINGKKQWKDFCISEGMFGGPTLPCNWLEYDAKTNSAHFKGQE